ncbi:MAG TPA: dodecin family protein [Actinomycetota bacterium]
MSGHEVAGGVVKVVELVGSSDTSFSDAVRNAVRVASSTLRNIQGVDVIGSSATVGDDGELTLYKVQCKVAFLVEHGTAQSNAGETGGSGQGESGHPTDEPPDGITAETIASVDDGRDH